MSINLKAARKELSEIKARAEALEKLIENAKREPRELPYDLDVMIEGIKDGSLSAEIMVGDYIKIDLLTGEEIKLVVIGEKHDVTPCGKKTNFTFGVFGMEMWFPMNLTNTNETGWENCLMRTKYLPRIFNLLPRCLQSAIVPVQKETSKGGGKSKIISTADKLFLFSEVELSGKPSYSYDGEGEQYEFFKDCPENLFKEWSFLRSPSRGFSCYFCCVYGGDFNCSYASSRCAVAFGFSI